tara:strand:- start:235 stop:1329 length:1095 start_codon:yes stop_codon:yes gene_type:complete
MKVLSLFDGMSCGRIALDRAGIEVTSYHASELDKYAIQVTQANWPETVQLGDVTGWRDWDIDWKGIDLLMGGSPCQGFSFAGKQLAFDDPRSKLFFVYVDILNHIKTLNPNVKFMLENVRMKKEYLDVISRVLGVEPVFINSALVSAQNRQRFYWANWTVEQPEDKGILLADILEFNSNNITVMSDKFIKRNAHILRDDLSGKAKSLSSMEYVKNGRQGDYISCESVEEKYYLSEKAVKYINQDNRINKKLTAINGIKSLPLMAQYDQSKNGTFLCVDSNGRVDAVKTGPITSRYHKGVESHGSNPFLLDVKTSRYRKLTPIECERLQTVSDNYTNHVSNTQRYKMLGNGWTVDVIAHIFKQGL